MGKLIYDIDEGYSYISDNGIKYDLLEGKSLCGKTTSDILYIHLYYDAELFENVLYKHDEIDEFVGWFYGATMVNEPKLSFQKEFKDYVERFVNEYEEKYPEIVSYFSSKKKYKVIKEFVVEVEARNENEATELAEYKFATDECTIYPYIEEV